MIGNVEVHVHRMPRYRGSGIELSFVVRGPMGAASIMKAGDLVPLQVGDLMEPTIRLDDETAQMLCDALFDAGVRPTNSHGSIGQLSTVQAHLKDLQRLVFEKEKA